MAKRTSEAAAPAVVVDHSSVVDSPAANASPGATLASKIDDGATEVIRWGNGVPEGDATVVFEGEGEQPAAPKAKPKIDREAETPKPVKKTEPEPAAEEEVAEPAAGSGKPKIDPARRAQILESLDREKNRVDIESRIKEEQTKREAAENKLAEFEKSPLGRKLATIAKQHGLTMDDLKDKLLIGAEDVLDKEPAAVAPVAKEDPKVAELLKWKAEREQAESNERIAAAVEGVRDHLKDVDLPLVDSFNAYNRVMIMAHEAWKAAKKEGSPMDYVPDAAAIIEDKLKSEQPAAARRLYREAADETEETEAAPAPAPRAARPAMGKRTAARPGTKPQPLPDDPYERDQEILRRFNWR